ncbi:MAG: pyridoxal phosphate-dependent aminotransferase [Pseudomonadota bacterium]|nr:pyridoxal phosphate-dependent aminotransferase [Pseudomonadota bacterium]
MNEITLSQRVQRVKPSPTLAVSARAAELRAAGADIIALGVGEPDFDTPTHIKQAAILAIQQGATRYTPVDGTAELKNAIINKFQRDNGLAYQPDQILVSCGGKQSFYNLVQALLNPGDEVIIPAPYWVSYPDMVKLADGEPVIVKAGLDQAFKISPEQLDAAITQKTRLFVINSPSNPTGVSYNREELKGLADVLQRHPHVLIATDDMYEHITWSREPFANIVNVCEELFPRTMVLNGVSKAYAMTGWRIGYAGGPRTLIQAMKKVQSQSTSNPAAVSQAAAREALDGDQSCIQPMLTAFRERHDTVVPALNRIPGVRCAESDGTFYAFPDFSEAIASLEGVNGDVELAEFFLQKAGVALVPGSAFGAPGHLRLSFAASMDILKTALGRLKRALASQPSG